MPLLHQSLHLEFFVDQPISAKVCLAQTCASTSWIEDIASIHLSLELFQHWFTHGFQCFVLAICRAAVHAYV